MIDAPLDPLLVDKSKWIQLYLNSPLPDRPPLLDIRPDRDYAVLHVESSTHFSGMHGPDGLLSRLNELPPPQRRLNLALVASTAPDADDAAAALAEKGYGPVLPLAFTALLSHLPVARGPVSRPLWHPAPVLRDVLPQILRLLPAPTALDVGCGSGRDAAYLAAHGVAVTAVDRDPALVAKAVRLAARLASRPVAFDSDYYTDLNHHHHHHHHYHHHPDSGTTNATANANANANDPLTIQQQQQQQQQQQYRHQHHSNSNEGTTTTTPSSDPLLPPPPGRVTGLVRTLGAHLTDDGDFFRANAAGLLLVVRFLRRGVLDLLPRAVLPGGFVIYEHFLRGCELYGGPVKKAQMLQPGELRSVFTPERGFTVLMDGECRLADGRPVVRFVARRVGTTP